MQLLKLNDLVRIGRDYDGGYVISESLMKRSSFLLSFGINDDWSFEKDFCRTSNAGCYGFDFSVSKDGFLKKAIQEIRFFGGDILKRRKIDWSRWTLAGHNFSLYRDFGAFFNETKNYFFAYGIDRSTHGVFKKLDDILQEHIDQAENIFLKIDIEGYEYAVLDDVLKNKGKFHALAMEIHGIHDDRNGFDNFFERLLQDYYVYHVHANNYGKMEKKNGFPNVIEISCIRADLVAQPEFYPDLSHLPLKGIDFPNNSEVADFKW